MPEGPEVTIVAENLNKLLKDKYILSYQLTDNGRYRKKGPDNCIPFGDSLPLKVKKVENKGKLIFFTFYFFGLSPLTTHFIHFIYSLFVP